MKKINFSAGPGILPQSVFKKAAEAIINFEDSGLSILEISHRSPQFVAVIEKTKLLIRQLCKLDIDQEILFMTGGASTQFGLVPFNLLPTNSSAAYINTGRWAEKAILEATAYGNVNVVATSHAENHNFIPEPNTYTIPAESTYCHITTNNTVHGSQFTNAQLPNVPKGTALIADMSSDFLGVARTYADFDLIYAGAQKNIGPAGVCIVIVNKKILGKVKRHIPTLLDYQTFVKHTMYNTPPTFPIYTCMLNLQWVQEQGLDNIIKNNQVKATCLYNELARNSLFEPLVKLGNQSVMNATFRLLEPGLTSVFEDLQKEAGICFLKGHRSVGGYRASMYNAMPLKGVKLLVEILQRLEEAKG